MLFQVSITFGRTNAREGGLVNHGTDRAMPGSHHGPVGWPGAPVSAPSDGNSYEPDGDATALPVVIAPKQNGSTAGQVVKSSTKVLDRSSAVVDRAIASTVVTAPAIRFTELGLSNRPTDVVRDGKLSVNIVPIAVRQESGVAGKLQSALEATVSLSAVVASQSMRWLENVPLGSNSAPEAQAASATPEARGGAAMVERLASMIVPRRVFNFARLGDPLAMLNDPLAAFVDESASSSNATVIGSAAGSSGAWGVTCAVIAADVVLLTYMYRKGRRSRGRMNLDGAWGGTC
jgi:hypothetical protein